MALDHTNLPARHFVRNYLRRQSANHQALGDDLLDSLFNEWRDAYSHGKLREATLEHLSTAFERRLRSSGGFSVERKVVTPTRNAPFRCRHSVSGFLGVPMTLGRNWWDSPEKASREPAFLIDFCKIDFTPKKALLGIGFTGLLLTRHVLERIYERTEIPADDFDQLLHEHLGEFIAGVSLAEAAGLWLVGEGVFSRMTAVPYANGLMLVSNRVLWGNSEDGEFGFRLAVPSGKLTSPFISRSSLIQELPDGSRLPLNAQVAVLTCGITYLDLGSLRDEQQDYYYAFEALQEAVGPDYLNASVYCYVAPQLSQDQALGVVLPGTAAQKVSRAKALLRTWLQAREYDPMCLALPYQE